MTAAGGSGKKDRKTAIRSNRLAAALRENLKRRKVQERGREADSRSAGEPKPDSNQPDSNLNRDKST